MRLIAPLFVLVAVVILVPTPGAGAAVARARGAAPTYDSVFVTSETAHEPMYAPTAFLQVTPVDNANRMEANKGVQEPTPWCRKVQWVWLSQCCFGMPQGFKAKSKCRRILNTWMQKCVHGLSAAAEEHTKDVEKQTEEKSESM